MTTRMHEEPTTRTGIPTIAVSSMVRNHNVPSTSYPLLWSGASHPNTVGGGETLDSQPKVYLPRLVTPHPLDPEATIETLVEPVGAESSGRFRVVIQSGPDHSTFPPPSTSSSLSKSKASSSSSSPLVHASFLLPEPTQFPFLPENSNNNNNNNNEVQLRPSLLAWTQFESPSSKDEPSPKPNNHNHHRANQKPSHNNHNTTQMVSSFICVLVHPNLVSIHNVYPSTRGEEQWTVQQEGWSVPLPAECGSIFAIPKTGGLLIQRLADHLEMEDVFLDNPPPLRQQQQQRPQHSSSNNSNNNNNSNTALSVSASSMDLTPTATTTNQQLDLLNHAPALFTLRHYQQDLTPLAHSTIMSHSQTASDQHAPLGFWNDPLEQVLWVGEAFSYVVEDDTSSPNNPRRSTVLVVTHHCRLQRHAVWSLEEAPPPPKPPTLAMYYATHHNYHPNLKNNNNNSNSTNYYYNSELSHLPPSFLWDSSASEDDDVIMMEPTTTAGSDDHFGSASHAPHSSHRPHATRRSFAPEHSSSGGPDSATRRFHQEALAEALGVGQVHHQRKTPRHSVASSSSVGGMASASRGPQSSSFFSPSTNQQHHHHLNHHHDNSHFLSTASSAHHYHHPSSFASAAGSFTPRDAPFHPSSFHHQTMSTNNFFFTIHSHYLTRCLYQESNKTSLYAAQTVFLASDPEATGLGLLAWVVEDETRQRQPMRQFLPIPKRLCFLQTVWNEPSTMPRVGGTTVRYMEPFQESLTCLDAQPIQATPLLLPKRCCGTGGHEGSMMKATDILVLQLNGELVLHRAQIPLTRLTINSQNLSFPESGGKVVALTDPVHHRIGLVVVAANNDDNNNSNMKLLHYRVSVDLSLPCRFSELAVCAIQSSLEQLHQIKNGSGQAASKHAAASAALFFRADCIRVFQDLLRIDPTLRHLPFQALSAVVMSIVQWDLTGSVSTQPDLIPQTPQPEADGCAWEALLASEYGLDHEIFPLESPSINTTGRKQTEDPYLGLQNMYIQSGSQLLLCLQQIFNERNGVGFGVTPLLFDPLHLLLEDSKLSGCHGCPPEFVELLISICKVPLQQPIELQRVYLRYYQYSTADWTSESEQSMFTESAEEEQFDFRPGTIFTRFEKPPDIMEWIEDVISDRPSPTACYFESISYNQINPACSNIRFVLRVLPMLCRGNAVEVVELLIAEGFRDQLSLCESFIPGIAFPLLSFLNKLTNEASVETTLKQSAMSPDGFALIGRNDLSFNMMGFVDVSAKSILSPLARSAVSERVESEDPYGGGNFSDDEKDGLVPLELQSSMLFPDNRMREAARLLRSSRPMFLRVPRVVEITDHEYEQLKQRKLSLLVRRALALPMGRGMMTIGGLKPLAAESLPLPELCLKGRVPPTNGTLSLDQSECPPELKVWPDFHNGVAAGLRLPLSDNMDAGSSRSQITRTWILYNKPARTDTHSTTEDNANNNNNSNSVSVAQTHAHGGFLLALGLRGHLTALEMTDIYEYLTQGAATITVGVLLGMAANKRGSCEMSVSKMLCLHIPSLIPQHFSAIDVASAVQAAAVAGVGLLYQSSSHRMMTEFLLNEIGKRPESDTSAFDRESYTLSCGIALGMVNLCIGGKTGEADRAAGISDLRVEERLRRFINGGQANEEEARRVRESNDRFSIPSSSNGVENEKCSIIFEANMINTDVTAPAATLAIGLMYMKSGNHTIASAVAIPQTHFLLEFVRPDFLGLRVIARSLILWDEVEPSMEWIESQVPSVVKSAYLSMRSIARKAMEGRTPVKSQRAVDYDRRAVRQIYVNIIAGACFSLGLRYAGTADERAKNALFDCVLQMHKLREGNDPISVVSKPEFPILETCLGLCALSLAMVLAGTGDLDALRLFKTLRWRHDKDIVYGTHMVLGAATGLLFLGGGTMTLGREPEDIAALVAAFFPRFPTESMDNQYHLQALRHLYALAARKSDVWAIDVDTGERVYVPVETLFDVDASSAMQMQVPCLLRNSDIPTRFVKVACDEFYPMLLPLNPFGTNMFCVKRRRSPVVTIGDVKSSTANDLNLLSQLERLSISPIDGSMLRKLLTEQQTNDRCGIVLVFLSLMNELRNMGQKSTDSKSPTPVKLMWDLRLLRCFHERYVPQQGSSNIQNQWPLEPELLAFLLEKAYHQLFLYPPGIDDTRKQLLISVLYKNR